ncbi:hypothetical protein J8273_0861 [Carpediemonas membranifera]|uniref:Uncharacterized protein n=1 Tax=Carpediemonas membranifera TaxID=201153 RepID=A0A8J6E4U7_9EUKA|nr:hypothetical protein J8273_0861 [Carpediemonas membranifera]|eukprot:KAG9397376.1 hypothetical protein J8273_0861 [Carpediemonas membranifera]
MDNFLFDVPGSDVLPVALDHNEPRRVYVLEAIVGHHLHENSLHLLVHYARREYSSIILATEAIRDSQAGVKYFAAHPELVRYCTRSEDANGALSGGVLE